MSDTDNSELKDTLIITLRIRAETAERNLAKNNNACRKAVQNLEAELESLRRRHGELRCGLEEIAYAGTSMPRCMAESEAAEHYRSVAFGLIGTAARLLAADDKGDEGGGGIENLQEKNHGEGQD